MVNQLVGRANMQLVSQLKADYPACHFFFCVYSEANAGELSAFFAARGQRLDVLIELGVPGAAAAVAAVARKRRRWRNG